jgi:hypothetical protein
MTLVHNIDKLGSEGNHQCMLELPKINHCILQKGKNTEDCKLFG